jgi:hypothetical protein
MSLTSSSRSRLEKEAGCTIIIALCSTKGELGDVGDSDLDAADCGSEGADAEDGTGSDLGCTVTNPPLLPAEEIRERDWGRPRLLKREHTPNKLTPDCRHSSTVTSSTPSSFCSASLNTRSMSPEEAGCFVAERREAGECGVPNCKKFHGERRLEEDALAAAVLQDESTRWWMRTRAGDGGKARKALMLTTP